MQSKILLLGFIIMLLQGCKHNKNKQLPAQQVNITKKKPLDTVVKKDTSLIKYTDKVLEDLSDSEFVQLSRIDTTFYYDMKYATEDNFLKEKVYDCANCLLRYQTVKQLIKANNDFKKAGYRIKFFDCYRPLSIQKKMWKIFPDKRYVADPNKGSNHNRGTAVDITLVDSLGNELAMGTAFDHFGKEAHHAYQKLPEDVLSNRKFLKNIMEANGFWSITSEWWHYNLNQSYKYEVSDFKTECDN